MPRQARLDAPGTLHHVIVRGIEKRNIVNDSNDYQNFLSRLGKLSLELKSGSRRSPVSEARSVLAKKMIRDHGISLSEIARRLGVSTSAISKIIERGKIQ